MEFIIWLVIFYLNLIEIIYNLNMKEIFNAHYKTILRF